MHVAKATGCDAIHPGYGFLAENADFASGCEANGISFVGPAAESLEIMGDKAEARRAATMKAEEYVNDDGEAMIRYTVTMMAECGLEKSLRST